MLLAYLGGELLHGNGDGGVDVHHLARVRVRVRVRARVRVRVRFRVRVRVRFRGPDYARPVQGLTRPIGDLG